MEAEDVLLSLSKDEAVSGESIAEEFGVSRNAVWKKVEDLRERGFEIESEGNGYRLVGVPEYGGLALMFRLHERGSEFGNEVVYRDEVGSTNAVAGDLAREGAEEGTVVVAGKQVKGKGRREREWVSPEGGAWFSLVLRPELSPREASVITLAASVAVARALRRIGVDPEIKWPNDVLIDGRKVCGILVELQADAEMVDHAVVGIGLNANSKPDVPDADPTSVRQELGEDVDRAELVADVLTEFEKLYGADHDEVLEEWNSLSSTLGREVRVETTDGTVEGVADRLDTTGALVVSTDDGERVIAAGDCEHLRGS